MGAAASASRPTATSRSAARGRRTYATQKSSFSRHIAVVGGGLTGLTTAYYLAKQLPRTVGITLYEAGPRLGGWIRTDRMPLTIDVDGLPGAVAFERGPRTLSSLHQSAWRFDDLVLYDLALDLGLDIEMPPDRPRYIYHSGSLVALPSPQSSAGSIALALCHPLFLGCFLALPGYFLRKLRNPRPPDRDVSVAEWLQEITMGRAVGDNLASAMVHGIYGGDIDKLSAMSVLDRFFNTYYLPALGPGAHYMPARERALMRSLSQDPQIRELALRPKGSLLHFGAAGLELLTTALADVLATQPNIDIRKGVPVHDISYDRTAEKVKITRRLAGPASNKGQGTVEVKAYDRVISTLSAHHLANIAVGRLPSLAQMDATSITTVSLWYPKQNIKPPGFGYLIPRGRNWDVQENPIGALGVFFDSDVGGASAGAAEPPGTKLFVLLGGHYYDSGACQVPSAKEALYQAGNLVAHHLGVEPNQIGACSVNFAHRCIPQHFVGHTGTVARLHHELDGAFAGRLAVAGGSFGRIGAMAAVRAGYDVANLTVGPGGWQSTGLEHLITRDEIVHVPDVDIPVRRFGQPSRA